jgi:hypothetical protein
VAYFFVCSSFQGSFTAVLMVSISTLASWPPTLRTSRRYSGWMMSRVSGSIEIGPRGLFGFCQPLAISIERSGSSLPFCRLIISKISAVPSHEPTERKFGTSFAPYSFFHAATNALFAGRSAAAE